MLTIFSYETFSFTIFSYERSINVALEKHPMHNGIRTNEAYWLDFESLRRMTKCQSPNTHLQWTKRWSTDSSSFTHLGHPLANLKFLLLSISYAGTFPLVATQGQKASFNGSLRPPYCVAGEIKGNQDSSMFH